jgi:hypothetical protein
VLIEMIYINEMYISMCILNHQGSDIGIDAHGRHQKQCPRGLRPRNHAAVP